MFVEMGRGNDLPYEREVISIPAAATIDLIYKYKIHAHPNNRKSYPYKKALYYTFREKGGLMKKLFPLEQIINLNPHNIDEINDITTDYKIKERLQGYITDRINSYGFNHDVEYKFYILGESLKLLKVVRLPAQNGHSYFTISELYSGNNVIKSSNKKIEMDEDEISVDVPLTEGNMIVVKVNKYERNSKARKECLEHYGYRCSVCGFSFEEYYGPIGKEIIEVHHKKEIHESNGSYVIDPVRDLIPICSNCHTIIHSRKNYKFTIEDLKKIIKSK